MLVRRSLRRVRRSLVLLVIFAALSASFMTSFSMQTYFRNQYIDPLTSRARVLPMSVRGPRAVPSCARLPLLPLPHLRPPLSRPGGRPEAGGNEPQPLLRR